MKIKISTSKTKLLLTRDYRVKGLGGSGTRLSLSADADFVNFPAAQGGDVTRGAVC